MVLGVGASSYSSSHCSYTHVACHARRPGSSWGQGHGQGQGQGEGNLLRAAAASATYLNAAPGGRARVPQQNRLQSITRRSCSAGSCTEFTFVFVAPWQPPATMMLRPSVTAPNMPPANTTENQHSKDSYIAVMRVTFAGQRGAASPPTNAGVENLTGFRFWVLGCSCEAFNLNNRQETAAIAAADGEQELLVPVTPAQAPKCTIACRALASHATCHTSHVTRHTSHVTRHTSHVTRGAPLTSPRADLDCAMGDTRLHLQHNTQTHTREWPLQSSASAGIRLYHLCRHSV